MTRYAHTAGLLRRFGYPSDLQSLQRTWATLVGAHTLISTTTVFLILYPAGAEVVCRGTFDNIEYVFEEQV